MCWEKEKLQREWEGKERAEGRLIYEERGLQEKDLIVVGDHSSSILSL